MGSRDHSCTVGDALGLRRDDATSRCDVCQFQRGEYTECLCDRRARRLTESLRTLAANLAVGGALCAAFDAGYVEGSEWAEGWRPGCGRAWGGGA